MNLTSVLPHLLHQFRSEHDLVMAIEELSVKFTQERSRISDYLKDERLTSAYVAFYFLTNLPKFEAALEWMPQEWKEKIKDSHLIDVGAGPGTFSVAFRQWADQEVSLEMIETSEVMRKQAQKLFLGLYGDLPKVSLAEGKSKLMLFGHSANEMGPEVALKYIEKHDPQDILFIEPGTKDFFSKMLILRESLIKKGYHILYPCSQALACPLANQEQDWCHQYLKVRHDPEVERLTQLVKKDRRNLPILVFCFSKEKLSSPEQIVLRTLPETKFSFEYEVCRQNQKERYQLMKKTLSKSQQKQMDQVKAGDRLDFEISSIHEGYKRVTLDIK